MSVSITITVAQTGGLPQPAGMLTAMRLGVKEGAQIIQDIAIRNVSGKVLKTQTGQLRSSIGTRISERADAVEAAIGTNVLHGIWHEFGIGHGWTIEPRGDGMLSWLDKGRRVFAKSVERKGLKPRPWLQPALKEGADAAVKAITTRIDAVLKASVST